MLCGSSHDFIKFYYESPVLIRIPRLQIRQIGAAWRSSARPTPAADETAAPESNPVRRHRLLSWCHRCRSGCRRCCTSRRTQRSGGAHLCAASSAGANSHNGPAAAGADSWYFISYVLYDISTNIYLNASVPGHANPVMRGPLRLPRNSHLSTGSSAAANATENPVKGTAPDCYGIGVCQCRWIATETAPARPDD